MMRLRSNRGDTLVEVVLSVAILSVVLVTAFNIANLNFRTAMQAKERTQASFLIQRQAEQTRYLRDVKLDDPTYNIGTSLPTDACSGTCLPAIEPFEVTQTTTADPTYPDHLVKSEIRVTWVSSISGVDNEDELTYYLSDPRLPKRDCSDVTASDCQ